MNNFQKTQDDLIKEASETEINLIPKYIEAEVKKLGKIFNKTLAIDENQIFDGIHGIITGIHATGNWVVNLRFEKDDFAKLSKIKGLRWLETKKNYLLVGWEHKA